MPAHAPRQRTETATWLWPFTDNTVIVKGLALRESMPTGFAS
jgi:hypothetical protein